MTADPTGAQDWQPERYATNARFVADLGSDLLELLAPRPGERILDLGCGDGALTEAIAVRGASVLGIDSSLAMVEAAKARGLDARVADGERLEAESGFDAVFSNAALHWMRDPDAVLKGVEHALKPGGRFVAEFGGHGNVAAIRTALAAVLARHGVDAAAVSPWYFPTAEAYARRVEAAGLAPETLSLFARPVVLPTDMAGWLSTFAEPFFTALPDAARAASEAAVLDLLRPVLCDEAGRWTADYVRLRVVARRPNPAD